MLAWLNIDVPAIRHGVQALRVGSNTNEGAGIKSSPELDTARKDFSNTQDRPAA